MAVLDRLADPASLTGEDFEKRMQPLFDRGIEALPVLFAHLDDRRGAWAPAPAPERELPDDDPTADPTNEDLRPEGAPGRLPGESHRDWVQRVFPPAKPGTICIGSLCCSAINRIAFAGMVLNKWKGGPPAMSTREWHEWLQSVDPAAGIADLRQEISDLRDSLERRYSRDR
ncbi:MAG: hypothetical protein AB7K09_11485 [Planctomycetota bacterium]